MRIKTKSALILFTLAASSVLAAGTEIIGCATEINGVCNQCFKRKILLNEKGCGPLEPESDPCLLYTYGANNTVRCDGCKIGFAERITQGKGTECVKGTIEGCVFEFHKRKIKSCAVCLDGKFATFNKTTLTGSCVKAIKPLPHCKWGGIRKNPEGAGNCFRCEKGYTVNQQTGNCVVSQEQGCLSEFLSTCQGCNPWDGYFVGTNGGVITPEISSLLVRMLRL